MRIQPLVSRALIGVLLLGSVPAHAGFQEDIADIRERIELIKTEAMQMREVPGRYIVLLKEGVSAETVAKKHKLSIDGTYDAVMKGFVGSGAPGLLQKLAADEGVALVEPDYIVHAFAQAVPSGVDRVDADLSSTADIDGDGSAVDADIAIIDTGIYKYHKDLNVVGGYNCTSSMTTRWEDKNGHGTHVAGTAAARDNDIGVVGVAPGARLWSVKVLGSNGSGYVSWIICGMNWVAQNAGVIDVANMSLGGQFTSSALNAAIDGAIAKGVTFIVAAGNSNMDAASFSPASHPDVLTVSAIADTDGACGSLGFSTSYGGDDMRATFSNYGSTVDIAAPGVNIYSTSRSGGYTTLSGTSMASPHVAGAAALYVASHGRDVNGDSLVNAADASAIRSALVASAASQSQACVTSANDGNGGFTGDTDGFAEPLLQARTF